MLEIRPMCIRRVVHSFFNSFERHPSESFRYLQFEDSFGDIEFLHAVLKARVFCLQKDCLLSRVGVLGANLIL